MAASLPRVRTHTLLRGMGGTTSVARAVHAGLEDAGAGCGFCYECDDGLGVDGDVAAPPAQAGAMAAAAGAGLVHVHASSDWAACMNGLADRGIRTVATLHDCRAFTGGCPYPLECEAWLTGCRADCPREYADADAVARARREAFERAAPLVLTPSRWMAGLARQVWPGLTVRVVPNGVPWPERLPNRARTRRDVGVAPGARVMLFVAHGGVDAAYKQGRNVLDIYDIVKKSVPETVCYMVGGERMERRGDVVYLPYVDAPVMRALMRAADVLVMPSRADNHPLVVLEAMSMGLPVVAFATGGIPEQLRDGEEGFLAEPGDWGTMWRSVRSLLRDARLSRTVGDAARAGGAKRFTQQRMVADYLKQYSLLTAK